MPFFVISFEHVFVGWSIFKSNHSEKLWKITLHSSSQGNTWGSSFIIVFCSVYSKNLKLYEKIFHQRSHSSSQVEKYLWYYNKSINWGDTNDFIANVENFFVCYDKLLEDTIQNNFQKLWKFSRQKGKYLWWSSLPAKSLSLRFTPLLLMITTLQLY